MIFFCSESVKYLYPRCPLQTWLSFWVQPVPTKHVFSKSRCRHATGTHKRFGWCNQVLAPTTMSIRLVWHRPWERRSHSVGHVFIALYIHSLNIICTAIFLWGLVYSNAVDLDSACGYCHRGFEWKSVRLFLNPGVQCCVYDKCRLIVTSVALQFHGAPNNKKYRCFWSPQCIFINLNCLLAALVASYMW